MAASSIMTPLGIAALHSREGVRLTAYLDTQGVWTIGYGHTKTAKRGMVITQAQAEALFLNDLASHALPIISAIKVPVADHERDALISVAFNIGVNGFKTSTFLKRLNAGAPKKEVADAIMQWTKNKELITRRRAEADQFLTPYSVRAPKARSDDAKPVSVPISKQTPAAPPPLVIKPTAPGKSPMPAPLPANDTGKQPMVKTGGLLAWISSLFEKAS